ncbi:MAG: hypothetical protein MRY49_00140 [Candidatus Pacebacteria bacterium]|nr:hypothetical protein [Candidatus Paceibacterota bacterium]
MQKKLMFLLSIILFVLAINIHYNWPKPDERKEVSYSGYVGDYWVSIFKRTEADGTSYMTINILELGVLVYRNDEIVSIESNDDERAEKLAKKALVLLTDSDETSP